MKKMIITQIIVSVLFVCLFATVFNRLDGFILEGMRKYLVGGAIALAFVAIVSIIVYGLFMLFTLHIWAGGILFTLYLCAAPGGGVVAPIIGVGIIVAVLWAAAFATSVVSDYVTGCSLNGFRLPIKLRNRLLIVQSLVISCIIMPIVFM